MRYTISEIKNKTPSIANAYGIGRMSLFGFYARGEVIDDRDDVTTGIEDKSFLSTIMKEGALLYEE